MHSSVYFDALLDEIPEEIAEKYNIKPGVVVSASNDPDSLEPGSVIIEVDGQKVETVDGVILALSKKSVKDNIPVLLENESNKKKVVYPELITRRQFAELVLYDIRLSDLMQWAEAEAYGDPWQFEFLKVSQIYEKIKKAEGKNAFKNDFSDMISSLN